MEKRGLMICSFALFVMLFVLPAVNAEVYFGDLDRVYNSGDEFNLSMDVTSSSYISDFFKASIVCFDFYEYVEEVVTSNETNSSGENSTTSEIVMEKQSGTVEIYRAPMTISEGQTKNINLEIKLDKFLIGNMSGDCVVRTEYGGDKQDSNVFVISRELEVKLDLSGIVFKPEEKFQVVGEAYRIKGAAVDGFAEAKIEALNLSIIGVVKGGLFNFNFTIPRDASEGTYEIKVRVYERDSNRLMINEGEGIGNFRVSQINEEIKIAVESQTIIPGNDYVFNVLLYNQAKDEVISDAGVVIYSPDSSVFEKRLVKTGTSQTIKLEKNVTFGYWKIEATLENLTSVRTFFVEELMDASFELVDGLLIVTNLGNVPYTKPIEVKIGDRTELINANIPLNDVQKFKISAPDGEYDVSVHDGENNRDMGTSFLTGNAVSVRDVATFGGGISGAVIWIIIILIFAAIAVYLYRTTRKKDYLGKTPNFQQEGFFRKNENSEEKSEKPMLYNSNLKNKIMNRGQSNRGSLRSDENKETISGGGVNNGEKQKTEIIALKIKNLKYLGGTNALNSIDQALAKSKSLGSKIYVDGDYRIVIFSKNTSGEINNSLRSVKTAKKMEEILTAHNKVYSPKIKFGIGVNTGEMIVESNEGKLRFTSIGNVISHAKKISEDSIDEVLLSDRMHRELAGSVKGESNGQNWKLKRISDREEHSEFMKRFIGKK